MKKEVNQIPAEYQERCKNLHDTLREHKEARHLTNQDISELIKVPFDRSQKFFAGKLKNPNVFGVMSLCMLFGLSLDSLLGNPYGATGGQDADIADLKHENQILKLKLEHEQEKSQRAEKAQKRTATLLAVMVFALIIYFGIDIANRDVGFVRDTYILPMAFLVGAVIVGGVVTLIGMIVGLFKEYRKKENHRD